MLDPLLRLALMRTGVPRLPTHLVTWLAVARWDEGWGTPTLDIVEGSKRPATIRPFSAHPLHVP